MAINFPNSPSDGDTHTSGGKTFTYDATAGVWNPASSSGGGSGVTSYTNFAAFPGSPTEGDLAYAQDTNALYLYDGTGTWDRVYTGLSEVPEFTTSPATSYNLAQDGTATTVTVAATDPEGFDVTYSYDTNPSNQAQATITNSGGTFTITPSTNSANAGTFDLRFKASDGLHIGSKTSTFSLGFSTEWFSQIYNSTNTNNASYDLAVDSNDNIYIVGGTLGNAYNTGKCAIHKVDKYGALIWTKTLEVTETGTTGAFFNSIAIDTNDNIYAAGQFLDGSEEKYIVVKYNTSGVVQFAKKYVYTGKSNRLGTNLAISPNNNDIYLGFGSTTDAIGTTGQTARFIIKLNSSGVTQWTKAMKNSVYPEIGYVGNLFADNTYVYSASRTPVSLDDASASHYVSGIVRLNGSNGTFSAIRLMNDAQLQNVNSGNVGGGYYDSSNGRIYQCFMVRNNTFVSGTNHYGAGVYYITGSTMATQSGNQAVVHPTTTDIAALYQDGSNEQGRLVKSGSNIYLPIRLSKSTGTEGYFTLISAFSSSGGTGYSSVGYISTPSDTQSTGIYPASTATTSDGTVLVLVKIGGDASSATTGGNVQQDTGLLSFDPSGTFPTSTTLGVNSDISLTAGNPPSMGTTTLTALNFATAPSSGTYSSATPDTYVESTLSNTASTDSSTRDYTNLA